MAGPLAVAGLSERRRGVRAEGEVADGPPWRQVVPSGAVVGTDGAAAGGCPRHSSARRAASSSRCHLDALKVRRALSFILTHASGFCFCLSLSSGFLLLTLAFFLCFEGKERLSEDDGSFLRSLPRLLCFAEGLFFGLPA